MKKILFLVLVVSLVSVLCFAGAEGSMLDAVCSSLDAGVGAHLNYSVVISSMSDIVPVRDVHAKAGSFYSMETSSLYGYTFRSGECFLGDTAYTLNPEKMEARVATTVSSSIIKNNVLLLDDLYKLIAGHAGRTDFTTETREVEGKSCTALVYPEKGYDAEAVFCFDESGNLVYVLESAPVLMPSLGETFYTVYQIDTAVDESLFDISAYTIIEK